MLQESDDFHPARVGQREIRLRAAVVDLSDFFSAPWGRLSLVEIPAGARTEEYFEAMHDENIFVVSGNATIEVAGELFNSADEHGLNVLIPRRVRRTLVNRSSVSPLLILSVLVRRGDV
jgi:uncharacterized RmlC-like cupin family protein